MKIHVKHILVHQRFEAEDVSKKLQEGEVFEDLAEKFSTCSSARLGGDLGLVEIRRLDSDFAEAAQDLKVGEISSPVRTRFGYHLIKRIG